LVVRSVACSKQADPDLIHGFGVTLTIDFCGETHPVVAGQTFSIGREGDLSVDDNPFLHRRFLVLTQQGDLWVLNNVGTQLTATVSDVSGHMEAFLAPGGSLPLAFDETFVSFTAGPTSYSLSITNSDPPFAGVPVQINESGNTTIGATQLTPDQRRLVVALAEPRLRGDGKASVVLPSSSEAAERLGWTITKFNRKLDNVCQKLQRLGVRGLHGGPDRLASNRRTRLIEYAVATRLVTRADLALLDMPPGDESDPE
jgi:hypothetical protein